MHSAVIGSSRVAILAVLLGSCAGQSADTASTASTPLPLAGQESTTFTTAPVSTCRSDALPALADDASDQTTLVVDGGGVAVTTYLVGEEWRLRFELLTTVPTGEGLDLLLGQAEPFMPIRPVGDADVNGDGRVEVFVAVGSGAYSDLIGLWTVGECSFERVTVAGSPALFPLGGSASAIAGYRCHAGAFEVIEATSGDGERFAGEVLAFSLAGADLIEIGRESIEGPLAEVAALASAGC